jgi:Mg2+ and Co2+ transporter CorA
MIKKFTDFEKFKAAAKEHNITSDLDSLRDLDIVFYEDYDEDYMILSIPAVDSSHPNQILILSKDFNLAYCSSEPKQKSKTLKLSKIRKGRYQASTLLFYEIVSSALNTYFSELTSIKKAAHQLHDSPDIDQVEQVSKRNREVWDIAEDVLRLCIEAEEEEFKYVNIDVIPYEFDILLARARHLVDRIKGVRRETDSLRTKCDIIETRKLNKRIELLTKIMAVLTVLSLIISVPNTVATIFGIPTISALFSFDFIIELTVISGIIAVILSYIYVRGVL